LSAVAEEDEREDAERDEDEDDEETTEERSGMLMTSFSSLLVMVTV